MNTAISIPPPRRELAHRLSGGLEVTLYWNAHDDSTSIEVWQPDEEPLSFAIAHERALDAFYHPFAYLHEASNDLPLKTTCAASDVIGM